MEQPLHKPFGKARKLHKPTLTLTQTKTTPILSNTHGDFHFLSAEVVVASASVYVCVCLCVKFYIISWHFFRTFHNFYPQLF